MHSCYLRAPRKNASISFATVCKWMSRQCWLGRCMAVYRGTVFTILIYKSPIPSQGWDGKSSTLCTQHTEPLLSRQRAWPADWSHHGHFSRRVLSQRFLKLQPKGCWRAAPEVEQINPRYTWVTYGLKGSNSACISVISTGCLYHGDGEGEFLIICTIMCSLKNILIL